MRTIDPLLSAALAAGTGEPVFKMFAHYTDGNESEYRPTISKYQSSRFKLSIWGNNAIDQSTLEDVQYFTFSRGLMINGVEYFASSPLWYKQSFSMDYRTNEWRMDCLAWDTTSYNKSTSATQTAKQVLEALVPTGCSASFLSQTWTGLQWDKAGTVKPNQFEALLPMLWNKYTVKLFPLDDGDLLFQSKIITTEKTRIEPGWSINTATETRRYYTYIDQNYYNIRAPIWNIFWEDETGATHRLSATYSYLSSFPLRNAGFFPSTTSVSYIKQLLSDPTRITPIPLTLHEFTMRPDLRIEQGEYIETDGVLILASVKESFNISGTTYPWEMKVKGEPMFYEGGTP